MDVSSRKLLEKSNKSSARLAINTQIDNTLVLVEKLITAIYTSSTLTKIIPANLHTRICPDINMQVVLDGSLTFFIV